MMKLIREMKMRVKEIRKIKVYDESDQRIMNLGMEHKIPGSGESFLALAASKAHSLST